MNAAKPNKRMNEINDLSDEFTDEFLHVQADAGDYLLDEEASRIGQKDEMKKLALGRRRFMAAPRPDIARGVCPVRLI